MTIRTVIFDWDGTLARTLDLWLAGYRTALESRGHRFEDKVVVREFFHDHHLVPERHPALDFPPIAHETREHVLAALSRVALYDGARETVEALRGQGVAVALVTSSAWALLNRGLAAHGMEDAFASIVAGDDGYGHKPSTRPFEQTLDRLGATAEQTLVIGDTHVDIAAGHALGCRTCWFAPAHNSLFHDFNHIRTLAPHHEIDGIAQLSGIVATAQKRGSG